MPVINIGDTVVLKDKAGETLGELTVQESRYGAWCGPFTPASGYARVRDLFVKWTEAVNEQSLRFADTVDGRISQIDRKSTRLNSSHMSISYAVFCLKKKKTK